MMGSSPVSPIPVLNESWDLCFESLHGTAAFENNTHHVKQTCSLQLPEVTLYLLLAKKQLNKISHSEVYSSDLS